MKTIQALAKDFILQLPPLKQIRMRLKYCEARIEFLQSEFDRFRMKVAESHLPQDGHKLEELLAFIRPKKVVGYEKIRLGTNSDGGYVMLDDFAGVDLAYSLGISTEVSWDLEIARRGIPVRQYDYSIEETPVKNPLFTFFRTKVESFADLNLSSQSKQILKMDIEGSEWNFFSTASVADLKAFHQIVVEFHNFDRFYEPEWYRKALSSFQKLSESHQLIHVHGTNAMPNFFTGKYRLPIFMELSYVLKSAYQFEETTETFPGPLDYPHIPGKPDISMTELARGVSTNS